jgi:hypothetical protein
LLFLLYLLFFVGTVELVLLLSADFPRDCSLFFFAILEPDGLFLLLYGKKAKA